MEQFISMLYLDLEIYLGMRVTRTADYIAIDQERYTLRVLKQYKKLFQGLENKIIARQWNEA